MATDWCALITNPAAEYAAVIELQRFGLVPYLPQLKRQWAAPRSTMVRPRRFPLFPRYLLLPYEDAWHPLIREIRGLSHHALLADAEGNPWRAPSHVIEAVMSARERGEFDERAPARGDKVAFRSGVFAATIEARVDKSQLKTLELLTPLFGGGARVTAASSALMRL